MNKKLFSKCLYLLTGFQTCFLFAQNFSPMPVQTGFNEDVIANGVGPLANSTTSDVDGVSFAFVSRDFQLNSGSTPLTYGLPTDGVITSVVATTPGLTYKLANYNNNNSLKFSNQNDTGELVFTTPTPAFRLYMLATSGSGAAATSVTVNFTDNTSQSFTGVVVPDWYNGPGFAIQGFGRVTRTEDTLESGSGSNPRLYQILLAIDAANHAKPIQSVSVTKTSTSGNTNVFAFSADVYTDCVAPTLQPVGTLTASTAAISWTVPAGNSGSELRCVLQHNKYTSYSRFNSESDRNYRNLYNNSWA